MDWNIKDMVDSERFIHLSELFVSGNQDLTPNGLGPEPILCSAVSD